MIFAEKFRIDVETAKLVYETSELMTGLMSSIGGYGIELEACTAGTIEENTEHSRHAGFRVSIPLFHISPNTQLIHQPRLPKS
jgi:hypothetical protein